MALFPRMSSLAPLSAAPFRHEFAPFMNLFNDTVNELQRVASTTENVTSFAPRFDVKEEKDKYSLEGELPGIDQKDIHIEFTDDHTLQIKGRTERSSESGNRPTEAEEVHDKSASGAEAPESDKKKESTEVAAPQSTNVATRKEGGPTYWVTERSIGEFSRTFSFPTRVDQDAVKASLKNGILSVVVPKLAKSNEKKRIQIE